MDSDRRRSPSERSESASPIRAWARVGIVIVALLVRVALIDQGGLWADEACSLAVATGHSLGIPSDRAQGDFVEQERPVPAKELARLMQHDEPPAGPARVVRAAFLSEANAPLYQLLLWAWTLLFGTGDAALRMFSVVCAVAALPLLDSIVSQLAGPRAALVGSLLYALSPLGLEYSIEGRMYSQTMLLVLALGWLTLRLHHRGFTPGTSLLWVIAAAASLLTHYFALFVVAALVAWLWIWPGRAKRSSLVLALLGVVLLVLPWYAQLPEILSMPRIEGRWLERRPLGYHRLAAFCLLCWNYLSPAPWAPLSQAKAGNAVLALAIAAAVLGANVRAISRPAAAMLGLWLGAALFGMAAFDVLQHTYTMAIPRYAIAGLPAGLMLLALVIDAARPPFRAFSIAAILVSWTFFGGPVSLAERRSHEGLREVGRLIDELADRETVVVVHSIPAGVLSVARYVSPETPMAAWVSQLGRRRVPEDLTRLIQGYRRVIVVVTHHLRSPLPEKEWLDRNARAIGRRVEHPAAVLFVYEPKQGPAFDLTTSS